MNGSNRVQLWRLEISQKLIDFVVR